MIEQYYTFECNECGEVNTVDFFGAMSARRCDECGEILRGEPDAIMQRAPSPAVGLYECFDCNHTFGYSAGTGNNAYEKPNCTNCGSENTQHV